MEISTKITRRYTDAYACPLLDGKIISGKFPDSINSGIQYGDGVRALAIALNTSGMMSVNRAHDILTGILGLPISVGAVANMVARFGVAIDDTAQEIKNALLEAPVANCDETGARVNGGVCWLHSACNGNYAWLSMREKRGREGMEKAGFLPSYTGAIIHDCRAPYWSLGGVRHGLCRAHLLRESQGIIDNNPGATWAKSTQSLLKEMNELRKQALGNGEEELPKELVASLKRRYAIILGKARQKHPVEQGKSERPK